MKSLGSIRKSLKLTQKQMASVMGKTVRTIQRWELSKKRFDESAVLERWSKWVGANGKHGAGGVVRQAHDERRGKRDTARGADRGGADGVTDSEPTGQDSHTER